MSSDLFLQDFVDPATDRSREVIGVLGPLLDEVHENVIAGDGSAAVFGVDSTPLTGLMINDVEGDDAWHAIYDTAVAAGWVIVTVGGPVCIVDEGQRSTVPEDAADAGVLLVGSGAELKAAAAA